MLKWLIDNNWEIICFDFPQSGTGRFLHPNAASEKNKGAINPDIVAVKDGVCIFCENKDRYYHPDFEKINNLIMGDDYSDDISKLLDKHTVSQYLYGIGIPENKFSKKIEDDCKLVDFVLGVTEDSNITVMFFNEAKANPFY